MSAAGEIQLRVRWDGARTSGALIVNSRPLAARVLCGRSAREAAGLAPALFALCARAQGAAARAATGVAMRGEFRPDAAGEVAVAAEMAQEHCWRLLLDWPQLLGAAPRRDRFANVHRLLAAGDSGRPAAAAELDALFAESGLGAQARDVGQLAAAAREAGELGRVLAALIEWERALSARPAGGATMPLRPARAWGAALRGALPAADFCQRPVLDGEPVESGAIARSPDGSPARMLWSAGLRIAARVAARIAELDGLSRRLRGEDAGWPLVDAAPLGELAALARVETARGLLVHAVRVAEDRVADYAIVAPTEWNFHPQGPFVAELRQRGMADAAQALSFARRLALALDPCVAWSVLMEDAVDA